MVCNLKNASGDRVCAFDLTGVDLVWARTEVGVGRRGSPGTDKRGEAQALKTEFPPFLCLGCNQRPVSTRSLALGWLLFAALLGAELFFFPSEVGEL